jgi:hypothetical protein
MPKTLEIQETELKGLLEPRNSRPAWETYQDPKIAKNKDKNKRQAMK